MDKSGVLEKGSGLGTGRFAGLYIKSKSRVARPRMQKKRRWKGGITDDQIYELMAPFCVETRLWSFYTNKPMLRLKGTVRDIYLACPELRKKISLNLGLK